MWIVGVVCLGLSALFGFLLKGSKQKLLEIQSIPTSPVGEIVALANDVRESMGQTGGFNKIVEVKGTVQTSQPLTSELAKQQCAAYRTDVSREYEETYYDTNPQTKQRERKTRRGSESVSSNGRIGAFDVKDASGSIAIMAEGAELDYIKVVDRFEKGELGDGRGGLSVSVGGVDINLGNALGATGRQTLGYRYTEAVLPLGVAIYVLGEATDRSGTLQIQRPNEKGKRFIITTKSEEELVASAKSSVKWMGWLMKGFGTIGAALTGGGLFMGM